MPSAVHVVVTPRFAGVERYVSDAAVETASRGWNVTVVGGDPGRMQAALGADVEWRPGSRPAQALSSLLRIGRRDVCHAHMTIGEAVALATSPSHRAPVITTRHFAARRGSTVPGRLLAPWIAHGVARTIAVSDFVAQRIERRPDAVIGNGVRSSPCLWRASSRVVLVLQRLEREKDTLTALRAWKASRLWDEGWSLRVVGSGAERRALEAWAASAGLANVEFAGWTENVAEELARSGILLAPAPAEPFGLAVVEAMAAGVPVAASGAGGHLETIGRVAGAPLFAPGDADAAAVALRSLLPADARTRLSDAERVLAASEFTIARHVDRLLHEYEALLPRGSSRW